MGKYFRPMKSALNLSRFLLMLAIIALLALHAAGQDAASQIKAEIEQLKKSLKDKPVSDPSLADLNAMIHSSLKDASDAIRSGQLYVSLQKLGAAFDLLDGARAIAEKSDAVKSGLPAFEAEWEKSSKKLMALDQEAHQRSWNSAPSAVRALAESAQGKTVPLLEGGRGFAVSTQPRDGLFYVGQAEGNAKFAQFCAALHFAETKESPQLRSLLPELQALQGKTDVAYHPPQSVDLHPRFIQLNSALKLVKELDATKFYAGALLEYLEAVRHYGMLSAPPVDPSTQMALKQSLEAERKKLASSRRDESIAQLFLERAELQIVRADGSSPSADEWRSASVILEQVLPAYNAARKLAAPGQQASGKTIDVTLVRWPYT
jgi:hypothetical protein